MRSPSLWPILALVAVRAIAIQTGTPSTEVPASTSSDIASTSNSIPGIIHPVPQGASTSTSLLSALTTSGGSLTGVTILTPTSSATTETGVVSTQGVGAATSGSTTVLSDLTTSGGSLAGVTILTPISSTATSTGSSSAPSALASASPSASASASGTGSGSAAVVGGSASASSGTVSAGSSPTAQQTVASQSSSASAGDGMKIPSQVVYAGFALLGLGVAFAF
ncbi:hypothetical protein LTR12_012260 [Friedmanniomyces endolithicus]|nr:hypothetical protein LTR74_008434 [Friedmanniomyces endolithicus]KAK1813336.1 hypothetical protein LTR12_012260 [Friedmanniomyces endolithicus]